MKKFARNLLTLTLSVGMLAAGSLVVSAAEFKGSGTKDDPYLIETAEDFAEMIQSVTDGESTYTDQYFLQTADLDFTGVTYIVNELNPFDGLYNGQGYIIKNLNITKEYGNDPYEEGNEYLAPFGFVSGTLINVGIEASSVNDTYVGGGLVRKAKDGTIIVNCYTTADITGSTRGTGLVDYINSNDVIIVNCWYGGIASGNALVGSAWNAEGSTLTMCYYLDGQSTGSAPIGTYEAIADTKAVDFIEMLNANRTEAAALCGIDAAELVEWAAGENNATFVKPAVEEPEPETEAPETEVPTVEKPETIAAEPVEAVETAPEKPAESAPQTADFSMIGAALVLMSSASLAVIRKRR